MFSMIFRYVAYPFILILLLLYFINYQNNIIDSFGSWMKSKIHNYYDNQYQQALISSDMLNKINLYQTWIVKSYTDYRHQLAVKLFLDISEEYVQLKKIKELNILTEDILSHKENLYIANYIQLETDTKKSKYNEMLKTWSNNKDNYFISRTFFEKYNFESKKSCEKYFKESFFYNNSIFHNIISFPRDQEIEYDVLLNDKIVQISFYPDKNKNYLFFLPKYFNIKAYMNKNISQEAAKLIKTRDAVLNNGIMTISLKDFIIGRPALLVSVTDFDAVNSKVSFNLEIKDIMGNYINDIDINTCIK